jgi:hypothetical protein
MSTAEPNRVDDTACEDRAPAWPVLLVAGSTTLLLGYLAGRVAYRCDLRDALRRVEESPEPIEISIWTL